MYLSREQEKGVGFWIEARLLRGFINDFFFRTFGEFDDWDFSEFYVQKIAWTGFYTKILFGAVSLFIKLFVFYSCRFSLLEITDSDSWNARIEKKPFDIETKNSKCL